MGKLTKITSGICPQINFALQNNFNGKGKEQFNKVRGCCDEGNSFLVSGKLHLARTAMMRSKNTWIPSISLLLSLAGNKYVARESCWQPSQRFVEFVMLGERWGAEKLQEDAGKISDLCCAREKVGTRWFNLHKGVGSFIGEISWKYSFYLREGEWQAGIISRNRRKKLRWTCLSWVLFSMIAIKKDTNN